VWITAPARPAALPPPPRIWEAVWTDPQDARPLALSFLPYCEEAFEDRGRPLVRAVHADGIAP
jgi:hypothetical protein